MGMKEFLIRRIITSISLLFVVLIFNFILFRLPLFIFGTDPVDLVVPPEAPESMKILLKQMWGLPPKNAGLGAWLNYLFKYLYNMLTFNFGFSYLRFPQRVADLVIEALPRTLGFVGISTILSIIIGVRWGIKIGAKAGSLTDVLSVGISLFLYSLPAYWLGMLFILFLASSHGIPIFPAGRFASASAPEDPLLYSLDVGWHLVLPIVTFVLVGYGGYLLLMRNNLVVVLAEDFILVARAKGLDERIVLYKHALRNAFLPVVTSVVYAIALLWTGAILTEQVFSIPGIGQLFYQAILQNDWPVAEALFYLIALTVIIASLAVDIVYMIIDPRVRYG